MKKIFLFLFVILSISDVTAQLPDLIPFRDGFKMGYCDKEMKAVIEPKYRLAFPFIGERAIVTEGYSFYLIDKTSNRVSENTFSHGTSIADIPQRFGNIYLFKEGYGSYSIIDTNGNYLLRGHKGAIHDFSGGFAAFTSSTNGNYSSYRYGAMNDKGEVVIPEKYIWVKDFAEGLFPVEISKDLWGFVDKTDKTVIPFQYQMAFSFSEGLALVKKNGKFGFIDKTGKEVIPCKYDKGNKPFKEGLTTVKLDGKTLLIDKKGNVVKTMDYDYVYEFVKGRALVNKYTTQNVYGFIDRKGNEVVPLMYANARSFTKVGLAAVSLCENSKCQYGFIDTNGRVVTPFEYYDVGISELRNDYYYDNGLCLVGFSVDGAGSEFFIDTKNQRYTTKLLTTASGGYITAERYNEIVEQERKRYENWKKSKSPTCAETCPDCKGTGATYSKQSDFPCGICGGRGINGYSKSTMDSYTKTYTTYSANTCWKCNGTGNGGKTSYIERCSKCSGAGCLKYE